VQFQCRLYRCTLLPNTLLYICSHGLLKTKCKIRDRMVIQIKLCIRIQFQYLQNYNKKPFFPQFYVIFVLNIFLFGCFKYDLNIVNWTKPLAFVIDHQKVLITGHIIGWKHRSHTIKTIKVDLYTRNSCKRPICYVYFNV